MRRKILALLILLMMALTACQSEQTTPSPLSATLSEIAGKVDIKQAGQEDFAPASAGSMLEVDGQIQTGDDGRARLDLTSGTIIRVAPSSLFTLTANDKVDGGFATDIKLELGKIFIILNGGTADVETPSGVASVRGSYMKVEVDLVTLDVYVTCLEGHCSAENPAGGVDFEQGQKTILFQKDPVTGNWTIPNVEPMTPDEFQEWLDENPEAQDLFDQAMATMTALAKPTETAVPTAPPTANPAGGDGGDGGDACFQPIQPGSGSNLPFQGKVNFEWEPQPGAQSYIITFTTPNGNTVSFETTDTNFEKYIEGFAPRPGEYSWKITAFDGNGNIICSTQEVFFSKPDSFPAPPTKESNEEEEPEPIPDPYNPYLY
jgi:hypothetical protein